LYVHGDCFQPKEITEVKANVPAIRMEEVTPVAVSSADLLAPTEVYQKMEKPIRGKTELTKEDRKRLRRQKKEKKKKEKKRKEVRAVWRRHALSLTGSSGGEESARAGAPRAQEARFRKGDRVPT
jgi:U3 small nucleolar ribonucleoprotein component